MAQVTSVSLTDRSEEVIAAMKDQVNDWLDLIGEDAASTTSNIITEIPLVDTGRLKNSISHAVDEEEPAVYIGTNVEYAPYQEFGTSKGVSGKHFIQFGATAHISEYKELLEEILKSE
jgi:phage gpG-like protein